MRDDPDHLDYWTRAAAAYVASRRDGALALSSIYEPVIDDLLGDVARRRVLDAGCGDGLSPAMIELAQRAGADAAIDYLVSDLTTALPLPDRRFTAVVANMVLMDIPRIDVALREFARVLIRRGILVFSLTHPCFFRSDWVTDDRGLKVHKAVADYLSPGMEMLDFGGPTLHFHRPLSQYFDELGRHGFAVDALEEPVPPEDVVEQRPEWRHHRRVPSFIVARALLLAGPGDTLAGV